MEVIAGEFCAHFAHRPTSTANPGGLARTTSTSSSPGFAIRPLPCQHALIPKPQTPSTLYSFSCRTSRLHFAHVKSHCGRGSIQETQCRVEISYHSRLGQPSSHRCDQSQANYHIKLKKVTPERPIQRPKSKESTVLVDHQKARPKRQSEISQAQSVQISRVMTTVIIHWMRMMSMNHAKGYQWS